MTERTRPPGLFEQTYAQVPPWDVGHPQPAIAALVERGGVVQSPALDVGCGTGEHVLFLRSRGIEAWGVDLAPTAIARAKEKARQRGVEPDVFAVGDALALEKIGRTFRTAYDTGVFHVFSDDDRARYAESLARVVEPGGTYVTLVFSDREPADWGGPRRISERDFADAFRAGWRVRSVEPARFETNFPRHAASGGGEAWLAVVDRVSPGR